MPGARIYPGAYSLPRVLMGQYNKLRPISAAVAQVVDMRLVQDGVVSGSFAIATAAAATLAATGRIRYRISGVEYECAMPATITLQDRGNITQAKFGAWAILIDATGTVTTQDTGAAMAFDSAEDALLNLSKRANTAANVCIGYFTTTKSDAVFDIGTTNTNAANTTSVVYHVTQPLKQASGIVTALSALAGVAAAATVNVGTSTVKRNGLKLAARGAEATKTFSDADVITTLKYGGWLVCTDLAGTAYYTLAADGVAGSASTMAYNTSALVQAALDNLVDRLPSVFVPVGQIIVLKANAGDFTAGTTNTDATGVTFTATAYTAGTHDRDDVAGANSHRIGHTAIPAVSAGPTEDIELT
jgi:hypothetical protein